MWRQVAGGALVSPASPSVQAAERREALESAAALLRDPAACPEATLVAYIPWLLSSSQPAALRVLTARSLTPAAVLPLLPADSDVRWQYLAHLVAHRACHAASSSRPKGRAAAAQRSPSSSAAQLTAHAYPGGQPARQQRRPGRRRPPPRWQRRRRPPPLARLHSGARQRRQPRALAGGDAGGAHAPAAARPPAVFVALRRACCAGQPAGHGLTRRAGCDLLQGGKTA